MFGSKLFDEVFKHNNNKAKNITKNIQKQKEFIKSNKKIKIKIKPKKQVEMYNLEKEFNDAPPKNNDKTKDLLDFEEDNKEKKPMSLIDDVWNQQKNDAVINLHNNENDDFKFELESEEEEKNIFSFDEYNQYIKNLLNKNFQELNEFEIKYEPSEKFKNIYQTSQHVLYEKVKNNTWEGAELIYDVFEEQYKNKISALEDEKENLINFRRWNFIKNQNQDFSYLDNLIKHIWDEIDKYKIEYDVIKNNKQKYFKYKSKKPGHYKKLIENLSQKINKYVDKNNNYKQMIDEIETNYKNLVNEKKELIKQLNSEIKKQKKNIDIKLYNNLQNQFVKSEIEADKKRQLYKFTLIILNEALKKKNQQILQNNDFKNQLQNMINGKDADIKKLLSELEDYKINISHLEIKIKELEE